MATDFLAWNASFEAAPAGTDLGSTLDDRIQEFKKQVRIRLAMGGHVMEDTTTVADDLDETEDGKHAVLAGGASTPGPDIYKSDKTTKLVEYTDDEVFVNTKLTITDPDRDYDQDIFASDSVLQEDTWQSNTLALTLGDVPGPRLIVVTMELYTVATSGIRAIKHLKLLADHNDDGILEDTIFDFNGEGVNHFLKVGQDDDARVISFSYLDVFAMSPGDTVRYRVSLENPETLPLGFQINIKNFHFAAVELLVA